MSKDTCPADKFTATRVPQQKDHSAQPDRWLPWYFRDTLGEVEPYPDFVLGAYMRVIGSYWAGHCIGLANDSASLKKICHLTDGEWDCVEHIIFGILFDQDENGLWQNYKHREQWEKVSAAYATRIRGGQATKEKFEQARIGKLPPPRPERAKARANA
jgi:uncharacterized protein YdaU (DUF1376 family)